VFAHAQFLELREAYQVLGNEASRAAYDHERWLSGRFTYKGVIAVTPLYLLQEAVKLNAHLRKVDIYRMNKQLLYEYLLFLLQDKNMAILQRKGDAHFLGQFVQEILGAARYLPFYFEKDILGRLSLLVADSDEENIKQEIKAAFAQRRRTYILQKSLPWLAVLLTFILMLCMYFYAQRKP
jgi:curved DNA-binding protein CbpA